MRAAPGADFRAALAEGALALDPHSLEAAFGACELSADDSENGAFSCLLRRVTQG